jgi:hypothetical protein
MSYSAATDHRPEASGPSPRLSALAALALTAPVPTLGALFGLILFPGPIGRTLFMIAKLWLVIVPVLWWIQVEGGRWQVERPSGRGVLVGLASGLAITLGIGIAYAALAARIDATRLVEVARSMGLDEPRAYLAGAAYWIVVNSLIEEYVYRWFMLRQCRQLLPAWAAVLASAALFTAHHTVALQVYLPPGLTALASAGVLIGGAVWAVLYLRYGSIWPGWISHILADIAVFAIGWHLLELSG